MRGLKRYASILITLSMLLLASCLAFAGSGSFFEDFNNTSWIDTSRSDVNINTSAGIVSLKRTWSSMTSGAYAYAFINAGYYNPKRSSIALDSSNYPYIVWEETAGAYSEIFFAKWDGSKWVDSDGTYPGPYPGENISSSIADSFHPAIAVDSSDNPIIVWADSPIYTTPKIRATKYSEGGWSQLNGSIGGYETIYSGFGSTTPSIVLDSSNNDQVNVVFAAGSTKAIYHTKFNASYNSWVGTNDVSGATKVSQTIFNATYPVIAINSSGPVIAWQEAYSGTYEVMVAAWDGSEWVGLQDPEFSADILSTVGGSNDSRPAIWASPDSEEVMVVWDGGNDILMRVWDGNSWRATENISDEGALADHPSIAVDSDSNRVVAWVSGTKIKVSWSDGDGWFDFEGNPGYEIISSYDPIEGVIPNSYAYLPEKTSLVLDSESIPFVAWRGNYGDTEILLSQRGGYSNRYVYSTNLTPSLADSLATITSVKLSPEITAGGYPQTSIEFYVSNDDGATWTYVINYVYPFDLTTQGNKLKWKAQLQTSSIDVTPYIDSVDIDYSYFYRNKVTVVSPNGGIDLGKDQNIVFDIEDNDSNYATFTIYYDTDTNPLNGRTLITDGSVNLVGGFARETKTWSLEGVPIGLYYVCIDVTTDGYTSSDCSDSANRNGVPPTAQFPELIIESLTLNGVPLEKLFDPGQVVYSIDEFDKVSPVPELKVKITNIGGKNFDVKDYGECFNISLYQAFTEACGLPDPDDCPKTLGATPIESYIRCSFKSGESEEIVFEGTKTAKLATNTVYEVALVIDPEGVITDEVYPYNNTAYFKFSTTGPGPDIVISDLRITPDKLDSEDQLLEPMEISITVTNQGTRDFVGDFDLYYYNPTPDCGPGDNAFSPDCIPRDCYPDGGVSCSVDGVIPFGDSQRLFPDAKNAEGVTLIGPKESFTYKEMIDPLIFGESIHYVKRFNFTLVLDCIPKKCCKPFLGGPYKICLPCKPINCDSAVPETNKKNNYATLSIINNLVKEIVDENKEIEPIIIRKEEKEEVKEVEPEEKEVEPRPVANIYEKNAIAGEVQTIKIIDRNGDILVNYPVKIVYPDGSEREFFTDSKGEVSFVTVMPGEYKIKYGSEEKSFFVMSKPIPVTISPGVTETERFLIENSFMGINLAILFVILNGLLSAAIYYVMLKVFIPVEVEEKSEQRKKTLAKLVISAAAFALPLAGYFLFNFFVGFVFGLFEVIGLFIAVSLKRHLDRIKAAKEKLIK